MQPDQLFLSKIDKGAATGAWAAFGIHQALISTNTGLTQK
jgi:hypothetical protein